MRKRVYVVANDMEISQKIHEVMITKLTEAKIHISDVYDEKIDLIVCIGGDGTFIDIVHKRDFPSVPIVGINTGTLGFFQEINCNEIDVFIESFKKDRFKIQPLSTVEGVAIFEDGRSLKLRALNEVVLRGSNHRVCHLRISIDESFIENFSGDGVSIASSAGSTAYNYSLNGSIVDPRLNLLQVTPIAPMNTTAFRSFTSSILLPPNLELEVVPDLRRYNEFSIVCDGIAHTYENIKQINMTVSDKIIYLYRLEGYDFWDKVKNKFLSV